MAKSKNRDKWLKENYPRECEECGYVANNPTMFYYHKKIHEPIPDDALCDFGCGFKANYRRTNGKLSCLENTHRCPGYLKKHSDRVKEQWNRPESKERRRKTRETFFKSCHNEEARKKQKEAIYKKWGELTPEEHRNYRSYARNCRQRGQNWANKKGYNLGQQTYHVDHRLSVWDCWSNNIPLNIANHEFNLHVIPAKENTSKGSNSVITIGELMEMISFYCDEKE